MSEEGNKVAFRQITKRVILDKSTLTYRLLSRELGITAAAAKEFLNAYWVDPQNAERAVSPIWLVSGVPKLLHTSADAMDVDDDSSTPASSAATLAARRAMLLVPHAQLAEKVASFVAPPRRHIYALAPAPLPLLGVLYAYQLSVVPAAASAKWKPAPVGGYNAISLPAGPRKRRAVGAGAAKAKATVAPKVEAKPVASGSGIKKEESVKKEDKKPVARPMGQLGGLFADMNVPAKRKAAPAVKKAVVAPKKDVAPAEPKKKTVKNGIFDDEVDDSDDEMDDEMEAMLALQDKVEQDNLAKKKTAMDVDVKPTLKKPASKGAPASKVDPKAVPKAASSKPINSFFSKKA